MPACRYYYVYLENNEEFYIKWKKNCIKTQKINKSTAKKVHKNASNKKKNSLKGKIKLQAFRFKFKIY